MSLTRFKSLSIVGDSTDLPFLFRTGKVQQNAQDKGDGWWSIPSGGFTSQLKYKVASGRMKGQLEGYYLSRPASDGFVGLVWAQPHIWLRETNTNEIGRDVVTNGSFVDGANGWSAVSGTMVSPISAAVPSGKALELKRISTTGIAAIYQSCLEIGAKYTISFLYAGAAAEVWQLKNGTDLIKQVDAGTSAVREFRSAEFTASDTSFSIGASSLTTSDSGVFISGVKVYKTGSDYTEVWLLGAGVSKIWKDLETLKADALTAINASGCVCSYDLDEAGDLICTTPDYSVQVCGAVPMICGWGFWSDKERRAAMAAQQTDPSGSSYCSHCKPRAWRGYTHHLYLNTAPNDHESGFVPGNESELHIRQQAKDAPEYVIMFVPNGNGAAPMLTPTQGFVKNYSTHSYFVQREAADWPSQTAQESLWPRGEDDVRSVFYTPINGVSMQQGDKIGIAHGAASSDCSFVVVTDSASAASPGLRYATIKTIDSTTGADIVDQARHFPPSLIWASGWYEHRDEINDGLEEPVEIPSEDPHSIRDVSKISYHNAEKIFKQLLGDNTTDVGIPLSYQCSTVSDIHGLTGINPADRTLIGWGSLYSLVRDNRPTGCRYTIDVIGDTEEDKDESRELDVLKMLHGICITHGIQMIWKYKESQRSWMLTFEKNRPDTLASSVLSGRLVDSSSDVDGKPTAIQGGSFSYSGITAEYKGSGGKKYQFSPKDSTGRVQHTIGSKTLTVGDEITVIPTDATAAIEAISERFSSLVLQLSQLNNKLRAALKISHAVKLAVGSGCAVDLSYALNQQSGSRGGIQGATCESMQIDIGQRARVNCEFTFSRLNLQGIAPSMYIDSFIIDTESGIMAASELTGSNSKFSDFSNNGLSDLATFGCWSYVEGRGLVERTCNCVAYACWLLERGTDHLETGGAGQNVWPCTIEQPTESSIADGTAIIFVADRTNDPDPAKKYVLIFADRDNPDLQPCQIDFYGWYGDANGSCYDSDAAEVQAITVGQ